MADSNLSPEARQLLADVLDELIPGREDADLPGAGGLGIDGYVLARLGDALPMVAAGLDDLARSVAETGAGAFAELAADRRAALLDDLATGQPGFVPSLLFHTYTGYYREPRVLAALDYEPRPPFPEGYELEPGDLGLLDAVRKKRGMYREVGQSEVSETPSTSQDGR